VHPVRALLASGSAGAGFVANRLAGLAPVTPGWNHHRGRVLLDSRFAISPRTLAGTPTLLIGPRNEPDASCGRRSFTSRRLATMKRTRVWWFVLLALILATAVIVVAPGKTGGISVRQVVRTNEARGQAHVSFEIANETHSPLEFMIVAFESRHERTGWWPVSGKKTWYLEPTAGHLQSDGLRGSLNAQSAGQLEFVPSWIPHFRGDIDRLPTRVRIKYGKVEGQFLVTLKSLGRRLGLPRQWLKPIATVWIAPPETPATPAHPPPPAVVPVRVPPEVPVPVPSPPSEQKFAASLIRLQNTDLQTVLDIYADLAGAQLEIDPPVRERQSRVTLETTEPLTRTEAVHLMEKALQEQAGLMATHLDNKRIALRIQPRLN